MSADPPRQPAVAEPVTLWRFPSGSEWYRLRAFENSRLLAANGARIITILPDGTWIEGEPS